LEEELKIARALVSVSDKSGLEDFARRLARLGVEIVSTGGTAKMLREAGIGVRDISELTGFPEMLSGRVKTLHPKVHGGILYRRGEAEHRRQAEEHGIAPIDLVVVNLYPFEATSQKAGVKAEELIENIDIGGPSMVRSAAKNFEDVVIVTEPGDYSRVAQQIEDGGDVSREMRLELARKAFALTARYDGMIATELERVAASGEGWEMRERVALPQRLHIALIEREHLRYGENSHQEAALYVRAGVKAYGFGAAEQLQGKEISYNNLADLDAAWRLASEFEKPCAAIIKHNNPCGAAEQESLMEAYRAALACDPVSAFGGIIAFNRVIDAATAEEVAKLFVECIVAPGFDAEARKIFLAKKNLRLLEMPARGDGRGASDTGGELELKRILGGVLVQTIDDHKLTVSELKVVTKRAPTPQEIVDLIFAWKVCTHVKSNAIVFARDGKTIGIGAGQMSRVDSVRIAVTKAQSELRGCALASDAYFPFADGLIEAVDAGATCVIQPGGSVRDAEVIAAADERGISMAFTGVRHFRH
jgi:phosphoribosylaminoimidazolecarboxamide formyltransferase / IMP cyclohydrolase